MTRSIFFLILVKLIGGALIISYLVAASLNLKIGDMLDLDFKKLSVKDPEEGAYLAE